MFNLVVLCSLVAAASAGGIAPLLYSSAVVSPFATTISRQASSVIHPSPLVTPLVSSYGYGFPHYLKKRSVAWTPSIIAPSTYIARTPLLTSYAAPLATTYSVASPLATYASPLYGAHLIKKRSLAIAAYAPAAVSHQSRVDIQSTPAVTYTSYASPLTYAASPVISTPLVHAAAPILPTPLGYSAHFIKKRSPSLAVASYIAPAAVSHQARVDIKSTPAIAYTSYSAPLAYASPVISTPLVTPFGYSHLIKKRSPSLAVAAYVAPSAVSHQSRVDFRSTPAVTTYSSYAAPWAYSSPLFSHY